MLTNNIFCDILRIVIILNDKELKKLSRIKELRRKNKLSQTELAEKMSVGQTAVSMWENGTNFPKSEMLPKLAKVLGCTIDDLFDKEGA